jgi:hypothetical protein
MKTKATRTSLLRRIKFGSSDSSSFGKPVPRLSDLEELLSFGFELFHPVLAQVQLFSQPFRGQSGLLEEESAHDRQ